MKKLWTLCLSAGLIVTLAACNKNEEVKETKAPEENKTEEVAKKDDETVTYERKEDDVTVTVDLTHEGEELLRQVTKTKATYEAIDAKDKDEAKEMFEEIGALDQFDDEKGINYDVDFKKDHFVETLDVEYTKLSQDLLNELARPSDDNKEGKVQKVNYDLTVQDLEESGFKKKKK